MTERAVRGPAPLPVDPTAATVVGNPVPDAAYWLCHGQAAPCAPPTVAVVLADILGVPLHSNAEVKVRALSLELIGFDLHPGRVPGASGAGPEQGWTGMSGADVAALCGSYGVRLDVGHASVADLERELAAGQAVVVCLDTEQLQVGDCDGTLPGLGLDGTHALLLTGLDRAAGLVYLNSPVEPSGTGVAVPLDQFARGWAEAGNSVLATALPSHRTGGLRAGAAAEPPPDPPGPLWDLQPGPAAGSSDDPFTGLGDPVIVAAVGGGAGVAVDRRRLLWLPFSFAAHSADAAR